MQAPHAGLSRAVARLSLKVRKRDCTSHNKQQQHMDYLKPVDVVKTMVAAGNTKAGLPVKDLLIRRLPLRLVARLRHESAITATLQTNVPLVGAFVFPVGFVMIVLLGLELVTGSFAVVTLAGVDGQRSAGRVFSNLSWVFLGNLLGSVVYGGLLYIALTSMGTEAPTGVAAKIISLAEAKTNGYAAHGLAGMVTVFVKAILCNWMVCLGVVMAMCSTSTLGKIIGAWLPILTFFAQGFEHSVVNMFLIPTGMMMGGKSHRGRLVDLEPNTGHAWQPRRWHALHRPVPVLDLQSCQN